jgi:N utilization substance protein A
MNGELLAILDSIEHEKGISREVLISAVESALVSAAKKALGAKSTEEISVRLDRDSGQIQIFSGDKQIQPLADFGRIAAQTAKQVIIQKIREAEKEVVYNEFQNKIGDIVSGSIRRFEKGNIIVDLGRTEGLLSRKEQSPKEEYRQGERIKAYVLEAKKETHGPQIILSRSHPGLVKKLFEIEVPEIYEGIVEIKSVAREVGDRSKIAAWSKDEKVDCVGACVGMRGSRVKNIVRELYGEKIDIVRWSEDIREYITAALSPAIVSEIKINKDQMRSEVIVEDDQLSLAIGKRGQNVRLACKLTGWNIDIRPKSSLVAPPKKEVVVSLTELPGVGLKLACALTEAGFKTLESLVGADHKELTKVKGIGKKKAEKIIEEAKKLISK